MSVVEKHMKTKKQKVISLLSIGSLIVFNFAATAADSASNSSLNALKSVPLAELPAKAASLVVAADEKTQAKTVQEVVKAAIGLNPAAVLAIVGSIATESPASAATAAATAAELLPKQAVQIAQTAAAAAPKQVGKIVEAVCRVVPKDYKAVAIAVASVVAGSSKEILAAVIAAVPDQSANVQLALASYKGQTPSVNMVLSKSTVPVISSQIPSVLAVAQGISPHPTPAPPPAAPTPVVLDPGSSTTLPVNAFQYANPTPTTIEGGGPPPG